MTTTALPAPVYVAYFTVGIPVDGADRRSERAAEIVARYLYSPAEIAGEVVLSDDVETFLVPVRIETSGTNRELAGMVEANRGRLASGLYATTDPRYLMAVGPTD